MNPVGKRLSLFRGGAADYRSQDSNLTHSQMSILTLRRRSPALLVGREAHVTDPYGCSDNSLTAIIVSLRADKHLKRVRERLFCEMRTNSSAFVLTFCCVRDIARARSHWLLPIYQKDGKLESALLSREIRTWSWRYWNK